jgi:hypothetical protein
VGLAWAESDDGSTGWDSKSGSEERAWESREQERTWVSNDVGFSGKRPEQPEGLDPTALKCFFNMLYLVPAPGQAWRTQM